MRLLDSTTTEHEPLFVSDCGGVIRALNGPGRSALDRRRGLFLAPDGQLSFIRSDDRVRFDHLLGDFNALNAPGAAAVTMRFSVAGEPDPNTIVVSRIRQDLALQDSNNYAIVV